MTARVAIPVRVATLRLHLEKGRQWSAIEHLLLYAIKDSAKGAADLAEEGALPRRLVIEGLIRLMRVGWAELVSAGGKSGFRATSLGQKVVQREILPAVTKPLVRRATFAIDDIAGDVFKARDLTLYAEKRLRTLNEASEIIEMSAESAATQPALADVLGTLLDEDEVYRGMDPTGARFTKRYALVTVSGESVDGLPAQASTALKEKIRAASKLSLEGTPTRGFHAVKVTGDVELNAPIEITFGRGDLIFGGDAHRQTLHKLLQKAGSRLVIHSTFVSARAFRELLPLFHNAVQRGVQIDILWGKSKDADGENTTGNQIELCRKLLTSVELRERIRLHGFTTNSHAKLVLADNGRGQIVGIVGSCNWLNTDFNGFEVSAYLADPRIVSQLAKVLAEMSLGPSGQWTDLVKDLSGMATNLASAPRLSGAKALATLIFGAQHARYMRQARDEAERSMVIGSHRVSSVAETAALIPARAAIQSNEIDVTIYYGRTSGPGGASAVQASLDAAQSSGVKLRQIHRPRMHGKFLVWDENSAVITSQNWLSSDPSEANRYAEVGIFLNGEAIGREVVEQSRLNLGDRN